MIDPKSIRALLEQATARPWEIAPSIQGGTERVIHAAPWGTIQDVARVTYEPDLPLIVAAVNALPELLACWEAAERYKDASKDLQVIAKHGGAGLDLCVEIERARNDMFAAIDRAREVKP